MQLIRYITIMVILLSPVLSYTDDGINETTQQQRYIEIATQEWMQLYVQKLDPYQLQLLTSYLHLLSNQALYTANIEEMKQQILWKPHEILSNQNKDVLDNMIAICNNYNEFVPYFNETNNALDICLKCIDKLDKTYAQPLQEALNAVAAIGRYALTYHNEELNTHSQNILDIANTTLQNLLQHSASLQDIISIGDSQEDYKHLVQFYALQKFTTEAADKAWQIIALNVVHTMKQAQLIKTCLMVYETCFSLAREFLMNNEIPVQYRTLLFTA